MQIKQHKQPGFTLLELLIVVSIMAIIAGMSLMSYGNTRSENEARAVRVEMEQLRLAVMHYFKDHNDYINNTTANSPADIGFLTDKSYSWDVDYRKGWRGPYIKQSITEISGLIKDGLGFDGSGDPCSGDEKPVRVKNDPYLHHSIPANEDCKPDLYYNPYLFFDMDSYGTSESKARIVSLGENGEYDIPDVIGCNLTQADDSAGDYCTREDVCSNLGDDQVLCL